MSIVLPFSKILRVTIQPQFYNTYFAHYGNYRTAVPFVPTKQNTINIIQYLT